MTKNTDNYLNTFGHLLLTERNLKDLPEKRTRKSLIPNLDTSSSSSSSPSSPPPKPVYSPQARKSTKQSIKPLNSLLQPSKSQDETELLDKEKEDVTLISDRSEDEDDNKFESSIDKSISKSSNSTPNKKRPLEDTLTTTKNTNDITSSTGSSTDSEMDIDIGLEIDKLNKEREKYQLDNEKEKQSQKEKEKDNMLDDLSVPLIIQPIIDDLSNSRSKERTTTTTTSAATETTPSSSNSISPPTITTPSKSQNNDSSSPQPTIQTLDAQQCQGDSHLKPIILFCQNCCKCVCTKCIQHHMSNHKVVDIEDIYSELTKNKKLMNLVTETNKAKDNIKTIYQNQFKKEIQTVYDRDMKSLNNSFKAIHEKLDQRESIVKARLTSLYESNLEKFNALINRLDSDILQSNQLQSAIQEIQEPVETTIDSNAAIENGHENGGGGESSHKKLKTTETSSQYVYTDNPQKLTMINAYANVLRGFQSIEFGVKYSYWALNLEPLNKVSQMSEGIELIGNANPLPKEIFCADREKNSIVAFNYTNKYVRVVQLLHDNRLLHNKILMDIGDDLYCIRQDMISQFPKKITLKQSQNKDHAITHRIPNLKGYKKSSTIYCPENGSIYIFGGYKKVGGVNKCQSSVFEYNINDHSINSLGSVLPVASSDHELVIEYPNIYIVGGFKEVEDSNYMSTIYLYNIETKEMTLTKSFPFQIRFGAFLKETKTFYLASNHESEKKFFSYSLISDDVTQLPYPEKYIELHKIIKIVPDLNENSVFIVQNDKILQYHMKLKKWSVTNL
ncbi:hypothetical protein DLAC_01580 [Tieghemostelium lacteum]|uniref:B box-type domain-containing protein n=1 Tax=Tieghemostelium lacteum TaxID=361077 RepID=A0A152A658_TIELA|nr:hypothetical protein DLAC_01580 [Tieghemostelium lacteum]|eukprot:KYR01581.1 hypothetical protein DLAC_01580 [Tieghemostelium lacteum]